MATRSVPNETRHEIARLAPLPPRLAAPVSRLRFDKVVQRVVGGEPRSEALPVSDAWDAQRLT